jgi:hypothetical protein
MFFITYSGIDLYTITYRIRGLLSIAGMYAQLYGILFYFIFYIVRFAIVNNHF